MSIGHNSGLVAIVDDDESVQSALQDLIESDGLSTLCFGSAEQFLDSNARQEAACLIVDIRMPGMSGLALQAKLKAESCRLPIIFVTAHGGDEMRSHAIREGAAELLAMRSCWRWFMPLSNGEEMTEQAHTRSTQDLKGGTGESTCS
jgi:FixJ family two-component response regulator